MSGRSISAIRRGGNTGRGDSGRPAFMVGGIPTSGVGRHADLVRPTNVNRNTQNIVTFTNTAQSALRKRFAM